MANVKTLMADIQEYLDFGGIVTLASIATKYDIPVKLISEIAEEMKKHQEKILDAVEDAAFERNYSRR